MGQAVMDGLLEMTAALEGCNNDDTEGVRCLELCHSLLEIRGMADLVWPRCAGPFVGQDVQAIRLASVHFLFGLRHTGSLHRKHMHLPRCGWAFFC